MVTTVLVLFIICFYVTSFYILVYCYEPKRSAETILIHSRYEAKSFMFETFCFLLRNYSRSLIQSTFIIWYGAQLTLLCISNGIWIVLHIYFYNSFVNRFTFTTTVCYYIVLLVMDACFLTNLKKPTSFSSINYDLMILCLICLLFISLVISTISTWIDSLSSLFCKRSEKPLNDDL